jgi:hypothetical protein
MERDGVGDLTVSGIFSWNGMCMMQTYLYLMHILAIVAWLFANMLVNLDQSHLNDPIKDVTKEEPLVTDYYCSNLSLEDEKN